MQTCHDLSSIYVATTNFFALVDDLSFFFRCGIGEGSCEHEINCGNDGDDDTAGPTYAPGSHIQKYIANRALLYHDSSSCSGPAWPWLCLYNKKGGREKEPSQRVRPFDNKRRENEESIRRKEEKKEIRSFLLLLPLPFRQSFLYKLPLT